MPGVFINYRRADTQGWAVGLFRDLAGKFGEERVSMDIENIALGENFVERLEETLSRYDAMIVLIGSHWLTTADPEGRRRLQDPDDWIRMEIEAAFKRNIRVIPVLVDGAEMPRPADLPEPLKALVRLQAVAINSNRYRDDVDRLIHHIEKLLDGKRAPKPVDAAPAQNHPAEGLPHGESKAFFSYSRADSEFALKLARDLRSAGADIWVDQFDIPLGVRWDDAIAEALVNCCRHLVVLSPAAVASQNVKDEIAYALDEGKDIVPVIHRECRVPYRIRRWQRIDLNANYEAGTAQILSVLGVGGAKGGTSLTTQTTPEIGATRTNPKDGLTYVWIPPGEFLMGATPGDDEARDNEKPQHPVKITRGFWLSRGPVTVAAYERYVGATGMVMPAEPSFNRGWSKKDHPIVNVSWDDAVAYCEWAGGRLPTEAEWEYAARGGKENLKYPWGNEISPKNANYGGSTWKGTSPVGNYAANHFALHDISGNVWEWTADRFDADYYSTLSLEEPTVNPHGPNSGDQRVVRGGSWFDFTWLLRAAFRYGFYPASGYGFIGFRCAREVFP